MHGTPAPPPSRPRRRRFRRSPVLPLRRQRRVRRVRRAPSQASLGHGCTQVTSACANSGEWRLALSLLDDVAQQAIGVDFLRLF